MNLDYSSLKQPVTRADIAAYKQSLGPPKKTSRIALIIIGFTGFLYIFISIVGSSSSAADALIMSLIVAVIVAAVIALLVWVVQSSDKKFARLYRFAIKNNLTFKTNVFSPEYPGIIFDEGHSRQIDEALSFPDGSEIGNYEYTIGSGKSRRTYTWSYARIKLTRRLPNMVLDAKQNNFFGRISNLPDGFDKEQTLSLEGDFDKYFTLHAPKEYERDALYIFTPDVMQAVVDAGQAYDIEVIDDNLMLYSSQRIKLDSEQDLSRITTILSKIGAELRDQSQRYADERVGDPHQNIVAMPGRRLKTRLSAVTIITVVSFAIYVLIGFLSSSFGR